MSLSRRDLVPTLRRVLQSNAKRTADLRPVRVVGRGSDGALRVQATDGECVFSAIGDAGAGELLHLPRTLGVPVPSAAFVETGLDLAALYVDGGDLVPLACQSVQTVTLRGRGFRSPITAELVEHPELAVAVEIVAEDEIELTFNTSSADPLTVEAGSILVVSDGREATASMAYSIHCTPPSYRAIGVRIIAGGSPVLWDVHTALYALDGSVVDGSYRAELRVPNTQTHYVGGHLISLVTDDGQMLPRHSLVTVSKVGATSWVLVTIDPFSGAVATHEIETGSASAIFGRPITYSGGWVYWVAFASPDSYRLRRCRLDGSSIADVSAAINLPFVVTNGHVLYAGGIAIPARDAGFNPLMAVFPFDGSPASIGTAWDYYGAHGSTLCGPFCAATNQAPAMSPETGVTRWPSGDEIEFLVRTEGEEFCWASGQSDGSAILAYPTDGAHQLLRVGWDGSGAEYVQLDPMDGAALYPRYVIAI